MKVAVIMAMDSEFDAMVKIFGGKQEGQLGPNEIMLAKCGIGKVNSAVKATRLIAEHHPDCIISTGVAGGIGDDVQIMDVVVDREVAYHDVWCGMGNEYGQVQGFPPRFRSNDTLYNIAMQGCGARMHGGLIASGDLFVEHDQLGAIRAKFPEALAVDMESGSLAQTCHIFGVPFISFRVISDTPRTEGNQQQYENFWGTVAEQSFANILAFLKALPKSL